VGDDIVVVAEDAVGEPVVAEELQTFSTGLSSGERGGSGRRVILSGTTSRLERCHPAWSRMRTAWAPGATAALISWRCACIAGVSQ